MHGKSQVLEGDLGGGFKYFLCSPIPEEIITFNEYFSDGLKQAKQATSVDGKDPANQLVSLKTIFFTKAEYTSQVVIAGVLNHQQYGESTIIQRVLSISGGAGFLLSTVAEFFFQTVSLKRPSH